jgi:tetratricopeptide (TPR) repeat protein
MLADLEQHEERIELVDVPFYPQVTDQCGPAALATILNSTDIPVSAEELRPRVHIPGREGSLQLELLAATRHYGRIPYVIDPDVSAILAELQAKRPVLILQNLGPKLMPTWHYAVVVGYLPDEGQFVLRSGDKQRLLVSSRKLIRSWQRGDYWAFVALQPGQLPASSDAQRYLRSVAALEAVGNQSDAVASYRMATKEWPQNDLAWLGLGNALYASGDLRPAREAYQKVLEIEPQHTIAMNNLSQVYGELGCRDDALKTIDSALTLVDAGDPIHRFLTTTKQEVKQSSPSSRCL